jgi:hypothetical protein
MKRYTGYMVDADAIMAESTKGAWVRFEDVKEVVQEAYQNGKKEGIRQQEAKITAGIRAQQLIEVNAMTNL